MKEDEEDDLERALARTPWAALLLPVVTAVIVILIFLVVTLFSGRG